MKYEDEMSMQRQSVNASRRPSFTPAATGLLQRKCACGNHTMAGGECKECSKQKRLGLQTQLTVGEPGDRYEQEADRIADRVIAMPAHLAVSGAPPRIQRYSGQSSGPIVAAPASVDEALASPGKPLEPALRQDMERRFGHDFSRVRVHTGAAAEQSARDVSAHAYTVGHGMVFAAGRFAPGTHQGRRLIAHELTHVVQQSGADRNRVGQGNEKRGLIQNTLETGELVNKREANPALLNVVQRQPTQYYEKSENDVVESVIEALQQPNPIAGPNVDPAYSILNNYSLPFLLRVLADLYDQGYVYGLLCCLATGTKADHKVIVAIRFTQCQKDPALLAYEEILEAENYLKYDVSLPSELKPMFECLERERVRHEKRREQERLRLEKQREEERFEAGFEPGSDFCSLTKGVMKWRLYPATSADGKGKKQRMQIKFLPDSPYRNKTVTFLQTLREEGGDGSKTTIDIGVNQSVFRPFYGVNWDKQMKQWVPSDEGKDIGFRSQPNSADDPAAYLFDEPFFFPPPHGRVFESVAVVVETGETLGALTWGVGTVPAYAEKPKCADKPSADFHGAVEKFYTPRSPARGHGQENYDLILDGFAPNDATLTADQKKQLDSIAARVKEIISKGDPEATKDRLVVGGFGDSMDTDPMAASEQRTQVVANYLTGKGVPKDTLDLRPFGATWARYEVSTKNAQEGRNRRVQLRLFYP